MKRYLLIAKCIAFASTFANAGNLPPLLCHQQVNLRINPSSFQVDRYEPSDIKQLDIYRFEGMKLFLSHPDRKEYFYNKVEEVEGRRYVSGHKVFVFNQDFNEAIVSHTHDIELKLSKIRCLKNTK